MKIVIVGGGAMGLAFARRWLSQSAVFAENLTIIESSLERREIIEKEIRVAAASDYALLKDAQLVFIAVKPQDFAALSERIKPFINSEKLVISIMAGMPIAKIQTALGGHKRVIRIMPNLPIVIGNGLSVYCVSKEVENIAVEIVEQLLEACGEVMRVEDESLLNAVTAVSGSGPAYIYFAIEGAFSKCLEFGFSSEQAKKMITATLEGAVKLWRVDQRSPQELRALVTSKGGTTAAGVNELEKGNLINLVKKALQAACDRAEELSN